MKIENRADRGGALGTELDLRQELDESEQGGRAGKRRAA